MKGRKQILVWIIAGEPSGDLIGARLIAALRNLGNGSVRFAGIGGEAMSAEGLTSRFPMADIAVMGIVEIFPRLSLIRRRIAQTIADICADKPDVVVSIDSPGFCSRIWKGLSGSGIPLIHYVAPTVWAWNPGRTSRYAERLDHMIVLLPFEPPWFEKEGLACTFAGHPVLESGAGTGDGIRFRRRHGISTEATVISVLPGSRRGEIARMLPVFRDAAKALLARTRETVYVFPSVAHCADFLSKRVSNWPGRGIVVDTFADKYDAMSASDAAMATSGTVSLELALSGVPHVIAYRIGSLTASIVTLMGWKRGQFINLINILLERRVVPEFVQRNCRGRAIASAVEDLLGDDRQRQSQLAAAAAALDMLRPENQTPSAAAAAVVLELAKDVIDEPKKLEEPE